MIPPQLKAATHCYKSDKWPRVLPKALLGMRAAWPGDLLATSLEIVYETPLHLPGGGRGIFSARTTRVKARRSAYIRPRPAVGHQTPTVSEP